jgi:hypothetical protein
MTDTVEHPPASLPSQPARRSSPWRYVVAIALVLLTTMWVYALFFASKKATYRVDDDAWRASAEQICRAAELERRDLVDTTAGYIAEPTPEQAVERADLVDQATDIIEAALDDVVALPLTADRDRSLVADYEGYYRTVIADRRVYTARLREFDVRPYGETKVDGGPVSNVIIDFTTVNEMKSCAPPSDLTGGAI